MKKGIAWIIFILIKTLITLIIVAGIVGFLFAVYNNWPQSGIGLSAGAGFILIIGTLCYISDWAKETINK